MHGGGYLEHVAAELRAFLGGAERILFVPWALADHDVYEAKARTFFTGLGIELTSLHRAPNPLAAVGGGNTFRLLDRLQRTGVGAAIAAHALDGMPYIGSSVGTNVATRSIATTNDMPIVHPATLAALALVPFQINPHYLDPDPGNKHMGETREERIRQFHEENPTPVLGLREGCWLRLQGDELRLGGSTDARLFRRDKPPAEFQPGSDLSFLLGE